MSLGFPVMNAARYTPRVQSVLDRLAARDPSATDDAAALIRELVPPLPSERLEVDLTTNIARRNGVNILLSPNQAVVVHSLVEAYPRIVSIPDVYIALYGSAQPRGGSRRSVNTIRVMMTDLRKRLEPVKTTVLCEYKVGYRLELLPI